MRPQLEYGLGLGFGEMDARFDLIEIDGLAHAVGTHADVAFTKRNIAGKLAFNGEIPLRRLRVAVIW